MRLKDYIYTTNSLNVIEQSVFLYDTEHADILLSDGTSLKDKIKNDRKPEDSLPPDTDEGESSVVDQAIVGRSISK